MATPIGKDYAAKRYAVVTGANKGIGYEICKQLAAKGITVVLTARNEQRGLEAVERLKKEIGVSDNNVIFHQLDVSDPSSVSSLASFIHTHFGKLDILVNNAGFSGVTANAEALKALGPKTGRSEEEWNKILILTYDLAVECLQINYYSVKRMVETFIPLLQISDSPRIVNVSSLMGKLKNIPNQWATGILGDAEGLTEEKVDEVVNEFLKDFKEGSYKDKGWPHFMSAYIVSKAALNAYTRIMARRYRAIKINSVCPGFVNTDFNYHDGILSPEEGAESPVSLCLLPDDGPSGLFFDRKQASSF